MGSRLTPLRALFLPGMLLAIPLAAQPRHEEAGSGVRFSSGSVPAVLLSPDKSKLLLMERTAPSNGGEAGSTYSALIVQPIGRGEIRRMILPWKARVRNVIWAPDGDRVAFTILEETGTSLWVGDAYSGVIRMLAGPVLVGGGEDGCQWFHSGEKVLCHRIPAGGSGGSTDGQLVVYSVSGSDRPIGRPARHDKVAISPDGKYLTVETVDGPLELWDASDGTVLRVLRDRNAAARSASSDAVPTGPRSFEWRGDKPSTLVWVEAQDGGNPAQAAPVRDRLFQLDSPFAGAPVPFAALEFRSRGIVWSGDDQAVVSEGWSQPQRQRSWIVKPDRGGAPRLLGQASGNFITRQKSGGGHVLLTSAEGRKAYLRGQSAGPSGGPFLDQIDLTTGKVLRLWRSPTASNEEVVAVLDADRFITRRESATEPPNYFIRDLKKKDLTPLTRFK